jgi:hypothetical protein
MEEMHESPFTRIPFARALKGVGPRALTMQELEALFATAPPERRIIYEIAYGTGLRRGELMQLVASDCELHARPPVVRIRAIVAKAKKEQTVPLAGWVASLLGTVLRNKTPSERVFPDWPHDRWFRIDFEKAGIRNGDGGRVATFHSLRHTFITALGVAGVGERIRQELARHSDPRLTAQTYTDSRLLPLAEAVQKLPQPPALSTLKDFQGSPVAIPGRVDEDTHAVLDTPTITNVRGAAARCLPVQHSTDATARRVESAGDRPASSVPDTRSRACSATGSSPVAPTFPPLGGPSTCSAQQETGPKWADSPDNLGTAQGIREDAYPGNPVPDWIRGASTPGRTPGAARAADVGASPTRPTFDPPSGGVVPAVAPSIDAAAWKDTLGDIGTERDVTTLRRGKPCVGAGVAGALVYPPKPVSNPASIVALSPQPGPDSTALPLAGQYGAGVAPPAERGSSAPGFSNQEHDDASLHQARSEVCRAREAGDAGAGVRRDHVPMPPVPVRRLDAAPVEGDQGATGTDEPAHRLTVERALAEHEAAVLALAASRRRLLSLLGVVGILALAALGAACWCWPGQREQGQVVDAPGGLP